MQWQTRPFPLPRQKNKGMVVCACAARSSKVFFALLRVLLKARDNTTVAKLSCHTLHGLQPEACQGCSRSAEKEDTRQNPTQARRPSHKQAIAGVPPPPNLGLLLGVCIATSRLRRDTVNSPNTHTNRKPLTKETRSQVPPKKQTLMPRQMSGTIAFRFEHPYTPHINPRTPHIQPPTPHITHTTARPQGKAQTCKPPWEATQGSNVFSQRFSC